MIIDNFYGALYTQAVAIGAINPPGEVNYKGYSRKLFCSVNGHSIENVIFDKAKEDCVDVVTNFVVMTHKGKVVYSNLINHRKGYST